ncbi:MAG: hypothetical protein JXL67_00325 [Calditrichaeota bacterium]|nr:hypothetical protein [Calditrichota bacterium]
MKKTITKKIEIFGKRILKSFLKTFSRKRNKTVQGVGEFNKILVFRLDERIGNGLLLLPLLSAIRHSLPDAELHLVLHHPVAETIRKYSIGLIDRFWPYYQKKMLRNPVLFIKWFYALRGEKYNLILSSHNPDNFSLSQAILGKWCAPDILAGFRWKDSQDFYDVTIPSSPEKHYAESQLDLWRYFAGDIPVKWHFLKVPGEKIGSLYQDLQLENKRHGLLFWLGATGSKYLPASLISFLYDQLVRYFGQNVLLALGPSDRFLINSLPSEMKKNLIVWNRPLCETAVLFAGQKVFISADTGPAHLAAALGLPMLTFFINSSNAQYGYHDGISRFSIEYQDMSGSHDEIIHYLKRLKKFADEY